jgi:hypothetical protein
MFNLPVDIDKAGSRRISGCREANKRNKGRSRRARLNNMNREVNGRH